MNAVVLAALLQLQVPAPVGYVNDFARTIQPAESAAISQVIDEVRQKSGGEIVMVTLADLQGRASIDVARDIGRQWHVGALGEAGDRKRNAGVILLLKPGQRPGDGQSEIAIATGNGAEGFVTDALAGRIRDAIGRQAVETGSYGKGLLVGVQMLAQAYAGEFGFELTGASQPPAPTRQSPPGRFPFWILIIIVLFIITAARNARRRGLGGGVANAVLWSILSSGGGGRRGGWGGGGGGFGGGGGGFGGFGGGGGFSGGGASGRF